MAEERCLNQISSALSHSWCCKPLMGSCGLIIRIRVEELLKTVVTGVSTTMEDVIVVKCYKSGSRNCLVSFVKFLLAVRLNLSKVVHNLSVCWEKSREQVIFVVPLVVYVCWGKSVLISFSESESQLRQLDHFI